MGGKESRSLKITKTNIEDVAVRGKTVDGKGKQEVQSPKTRNTYLPLPTSSSAKRYTGNDRLKVGGKEEESKTVYENTVLSSNLLRVQIEKENMQGLEESAKERFVTSSAVAKSSPNDTTDLKKDQKKYWNKPGVSDRESSTKTDAKDTKECSFMDDAVDEEEDESNTLYENTKFEDDGNACQPSVIYENVESTQGSVQTVANDAKDDRCSKMYENLEYIQSHSNKLKRHLHPSAMLSIRRYYREIKRRICTGNIGIVCDHLIENGVLTEADYDNIKSCTQLNGVDKFLQILLRSGHSAYESFLDALAKTGYEDLVTTLQQPEERKTENRYTWNWTKATIEKNWSWIEEFLMDNLLPEYIIDFFMQENIFSVDEYEPVFGCMGRRMDMTKKLLEQMKKKLPEALFVLLYALKESDKKENNFMAEDLENFLRTGLQGTDDTDTDDEERSSHCVSLVEVNSEKDYSSEVHVPNISHYTVLLGVNRNGHTDQEAEIRINEYLNNGDCLLQLKLLAATYCEIQGSELGCVIVHLRPHSRGAYERLVAFCTTGKLKSFVLALLKEKEILTSLHTCEICVDIQVLCYKEPRASEDINIEEPRTSLTQMIKENRSLLCEELDIHTVVNDFVKKNVFTDEETTTLKQLLVTDRLKATDFFLSCIIERESTGIQHLMDILKLKKKISITDRLLKSNAFYKNPERIRENLIANYEYVVQEIDPSQFEDTFVDRGILDKEYFENIRDKQRRRRPRTVSFLREVLHNGSRALFALVDVLRVKGSKELVEILCSNEQISALPKQQIEGPEHSTEGVEIEVPHTSARIPDGLMWSCSMTVAVEKNTKDKKGKEISYVQDKEEQVYMNIQEMKLLRDEGIGVEINEDINLRPKEGMCPSDQRPVTQPTDSYLPKLSDKDQDKNFTFPKITRKSAKALPILRSLAESAAKPEKDSGIDISNP